MQPGQFSKFLSDDDGGDNDDDDDDEVNLSYPIDFFNISPVQKLNHNFCLVTVQNYDTLTARLIHTTMSSLEKERFSHWIL